MRGLFSFNGCKEHQEFIKKILHQFNIKIAVETGTLHGWTTAFLSEHVQTVYSSEIREEPFLLAAELLRDKKNVQLYNQKSTIMFEKILPSFSKDQKIFFYLDAHWEKEWPLFDELVLIGKYIQKNAIIVIDDFKHPHKPYRYDKYNGISNDITTVLPYLKTIYNNFTIEYLDGPLDFMMTYNKEELDDIEFNIYKEWFHNRKKMTTGKVLIYEKY